MKLIFSVLLLSLMPQSHAAEEIRVKPSLTPKWQTAKLRVPESVLWYQNAANKDTLLFVSEIDGKGSEADGLGGVAILNTDGSIKHQDWLRGLNAPKGMAMYQGKLYIADITEVVVVDIASAKILNKIQVPDSVFLNDVAVDSQGTVYISDTRKNRIYQLEQQTISVFLDNIEAANGLTVLDHQLYIAAGDKLLKISLSETQSTLSQVAIGFAERADGVEAVGNGDFIVSCWAGLLYYVHADGHIELLMDSRESKLNTADIGWDPTTNTLYIPTFFGNSVQAHRLQR
ncbi:GTP-binding protein [Rheinheimera sediminis]|uniref:SMP-30/gluconolactonase/LRE family protein n=1 Tax=Rheinheimera sp. YQF-1 TaxID=2499626 RepID=UPI000FD94418|nr:GTP-binding protein [Rheinheimera sp. YQF-1]RVT46007.1 GTP-binding protein [Rheinheimera sp. YQF-1]